MRTVAPDEIDDPLDSPEPSGGLVVTLAAQDYDPRDHESATRAEIARRLARLKRYDFAGAYDRTMRYPGALYFVPSDAVVGIAAAAALGMRSEHDLFGAVVPHAFAATKTITHPLFDASARAPNGWSSTFAEDVRDVVLRGYSAFSAHDARRAATAMLQRGPVRVKVASGIGGGGQYVVHDAAALEEALEAIGEQALARDGAVIEEELADVVTYSVGRVRVGDIVATYYGTQRTTLNNRSHGVYGGSALRVVRGDFDALLALGVDEDVRRVVAQARAYDAAADRSFDGFFASRRNYDVALGRDVDGARRFGVLEQSWRIGGASGAEIGALEAFVDDPSLDAVDASCFEIYGDDALAVPSNAIVHYRGVDPHVGPLVKYAVVQRHGDS
jgi:hypothetical protein